jgi:hypothetical protein
MDDGKVFCIECDDEILDGERSREYGGEIYCMECFDGQFFVCCGCEEVIRNESLRHTEHDLSFCVPCFHESYTTCRTCDEPVHIESVWQDDDGDEYCEQCYRGCSKKIHTWDYKPKLNFHSRDKNSFKIDGMGKRELFLGFEIETKMPISTISNNADFVLKHSKEETLFYLKDDSTIDGGFEMVSHPATLEFHKSVAYKKLFADMIKRGCRSHNTQTCGLHVHINRTFLSETDKIKMAMFVYSQKANIVKIARRDCLQWSKFKDIKNLIKKELPLSRERYEALNFTNRNTIELRTFKGTLKYDTFIATLEFVDSAIKFLKTQSISHIGTSTWKAQAGVWYDYIQYLLANKKRYSTLILYLKAKDIIFDKHIIHDDAIDTDDETTILESEVA